jgi:hypothetical protein
MSRPLPKYRERTNRDVALSRASYTPRECFCGFPLLANEQGACASCLALAVRSLSGDTAATTELHRLACCG